MAKNENKLLEELRRRGGICEILLLKSEALLAG